MPPLASDLIAQTKRYLYSGYQDEQNELDVLVDATQTSIQLAHDPIGISRGATISIDLEEMYVWATSGRTLTVRRGVNGSVPAVHADAALVQVRPKFSDFRIFNALNDELRDLSSPQNGLYRIAAVEIPIGPARLAYELPADFLEVMSVRHLDNDPYLGFQRMKWWSVARQLPTADIPSGNALIVHEGAPLNGRVVVAYKAAFTLLAGVTDDVPAVTGLPPTAADIPPIGAAIRLVAPREVKRSFTEPQGEPRRAEEVPPGVATGAVRNLAALRQQRLVAEAARLQAMYPPVLQMR